MFILNKQLYLMLAIFFYLVLSLRCNLLLRSQIILTFVTILDLYFAFDCNLTIIYSFATACIYTTLTKIFSKK